MNLDVTRKSIPDVLRLLKTGEWQVPKFQREFVWSQPQVFGLLTSVFKARPIGMVTSWLQPQGNPQTPPEPLRVKESKFAQFEDNPAVIHLILDGKQRLTTLAMAFGGLRTPDDRYLFSGRWFLDFSVSPESSDDDMIVYRKRSQILADRLDQISNCIAKGLLPLDNYEDFNRISQRIFDRDFYPNGQRPSDEVLELRSANLAEYQSTFASFQIPVAELPSSVGLAEVCEIFEVLNTTGTKVSTFDLIHNMAFGDTRGTFNLRDKFAECAGSSDKIQLVLDDSRPEFLCQLITGCHLASPTPLSRRSTTTREVKIGSIKGGDLIDTPTDFYQAFFADIALVNSFATSFFGDVLRADFRLRELPYPASVIHYFALRWQLDKHLTDPDKRFSIDELNSFYRAFFWRNALTGRYDQGFLTKFSTDLKFISTCLGELIKFRRTDQWYAEANNKLDAYLGAQFQVRSLSQLKDIVKDGDVRGALRQAIILFLLSQTRADLLTGAPLDRFTQDRNTNVDLHHIYPKQWCRDNTAHVSVLREQPSIVDGLVNLVPLTAASNNRWKTKSPATAIGDFDLEWNFSRPRFEMGLINAESYEVLKSDVADPARFWDLRATLIATKLVDLQKVAR